jgi:hypothetical protein
VENLTLGLPVNFEVPPRRRAKYAAIIVGSPRTFYLTWPSIKKMFFDKNDIDLFFFASFNENSGKNNWGVEQLKQLLLEPSLRMLHTIHVNIEHRIEESKSRWAPNITSFPHFMRGHDTLYAAIQNYYEAYEMFDTFSNAHNTDYQLILKLRPDLYFYGEPSSDSWVNLDTILKNLTLNGFNTATDPFLGLPGPPVKMYEGVNDQWAILSRRTTKSYCNFAENINEIGLNYTIHPEIDLKVNLEMTGNLPHYYIEEFFQAEPNSEQAVIDGRPKFKDDEWFNYCLRRMDGYCTSADFHSNYPDFPTYRLHMD